MKYTLNSDLERFCKKASDDTLIAAHELLHDVWDHAHRTTANDPGYALAQSAIETAREHLMRHIRYRDFLSMEAEAGPDEDDAYQRHLTHILTSDDDHFERHYFEAKRNYLVAQYEITREGRGESRMSDDDRKTAHQHLAAWTEIEKEATARGIHEQMQRNQELRNANFRAPENAHGSLDMMAHMFIGGIAGHQYQEKLDLCLRDVEIATEVGEADLLWRERFYLDRLREHIAKNDIVVKDTSK